MFIKIILIIFFLIILIYFFNIFFNNNLINNISFNVITLYNQDRINNIENQEKILNLQINKFNAIKGIDLDQDNLIQLKILDDKFKFYSSKRSNEIGCYLSHLNLLKSCKKLNNKFHIIFEDDFQIVSNIHFYQMITNIINQTTFYSFDIIFLGWVNDNTDSYYYFSDNLYKFNNNNNFFGTVAYIVNSNSLDKIIDLISYIDMPIDTKYKQLHTDNKLDIYWINPIIVESNYSLFSSIL